VNLINNHKVNELYDFTVKGHETRDVEFLCHRIIHSYIFSPLFSEEETLIGIVFTSDRDRNKKIYYMDIDDVIKLFALVGNDNVTEIHLQMHPETGEESIVVK
jgi:hypothetical protein